MAKVYILTDDDLERLASRIDRDPLWGVEGGSSTVMSESERRMHSDAHKFFNYHVRTWIAEVKR